VNKFLFLFVFAALTAVSVVTQANVSVPTQPRIIGGEEATPFTYPFMGSLQKHGSHRCGATYIGGNLALTAAHCVIDQSASGFKVKFGGHDLTKNSEWDTYQVKKFIMHEDYNSSNADNDIALLELEGPVTNITPVKLADEDIRNSLSNKVLRVLGWGYTGGSPTNKLQELDVPYISQSYCEYIWGRNGNDITDGMLCAGYLEEGGKDACSGDSGGPLLAKFNNEWVQVGIVSWSTDPCALPNFSEVYADVANYERWLASQGIVTIKGSDSELEFLNDTDRHFAWLFENYSNVTMELRDGGWFESTVLPTNVDDGSTYIIRSSAHIDHYIKYNIGEQNKQMVQTISDGDSLMLTFNAVTQRWSAPNNFPAKITTNKEIRCLNPDDNGYPPEVCRDESIPNLQDLLNEFDKVYVVMSDGNWTKRISPPYSYVGVARGKGVNEKRVYLTVKSAWSAWIRNTEIGPSVGENGRWFVRVPIRIHIPVFCNGIMMSSCNQ
jgi:hypothetical protein|tara:strand:+ start:914 stop:2398 length:1485 start_codon:yes stop_codon:yes gene_type:complete